jgi:hypothetical protein
MTQTGGDFPTIGTGIPPEKVIEKLSPPERDLVRGAQRPEDTEAVREVIDQEVTAVTEQLGLTPPAATTPPVTEKPPEKPAETTEETPPEKAAAPMAERVKAIMGEFKDLESLAKRHAELEEARNKGQAAGSQREDHLRNEIEKANSQLAAILTMRAQPDNGEPTGASTQQPPAAKPAEEWDWSNPATAIKSIVQETVQENFLAIEQARRNREQNAEFEKEQEQHSEEIEKYRPLMSKLYVKDRTLYEGKPATVVLKHLLSRAKEVEAADRAGQFFHQMQGLEDSGGTATVEPDERGALPSSGTSTRAASAPSDQGKYSETKGFKRLWNTRPDSADEMKSITDVLKERGQGDHIKF